MSEEQTAPLQVIGVGLGRTGTFSLKLALEELYQKPCYHMQEIISRHPEHAKLWIDLYQQVDTDPNAMLPEDMVKDIFKGYVTSTDHPACSLYKQLMEIYPNAKLILTVRDAKSWIESVRSTVGSRKPIFGSGWYGRLMERLVLPPGFLRMAQLSWRLALGHKAEETDEQMMESFSRWNAEIQRNVPRDRLLVFNVKEGWAPLCEFLDKPIPDQPFPHVNDRESMKSRLDWMRRKAAFLGIFLFASSGLVSALVLRWFLNY